MDAWEALTKVVVPAGIEPATPSLGNSCSILLSYGTREIVSVATLYDDASFCNESRDSSTFSKCELGRVAAQLKELSS